MVFRQIYTKLHIDYLKYVFRQIDESCYISFRHLSNPFANDELMICQR